MDTSSAIRPSTSSRRTRWATAGRVLSVLAVALSGLVVVAAAPARAATPTTIVSLTFDDGQSSHIGTLPILQSHGMRGTFYINSALVGQAGTYYMKWPQVHSLADAGNEIGGHTLHHVNLVNASAATATTEVCDDRTALIAQGFSPVSFAYPEAAYNAAVGAIVQGCGYQSARNVGMVANRESIPPPLPYRLRTPKAVDSTTGFEGLKNTVLGAEAAGGGWTIFNFHGVCDNNCTGSSGITTGDFTAFLDWLQSREGDGVVVRTVGDVMGSITTPPSPPTTTIRCNAAACASTAYSGPVNVSLSPIDPQASASTTYYTTDGSDPTVSTGTRSTYSGVFSVAQTRTVRFYSTNALGAAEAPKSQLVTVTPPAPSPPTTTIRCDGATCASTAYAGPVSVSLSADDPQGSATTTYYTTDDSDPTVVGGTRSTYDGAFSVAQTRTVRFYSTDALGAAESPKSQLVTVTPPASPPTTTIGCDGAACASTGYAGPVSVSLSADDPQGSATTTYYTTDGSDPTVSTGTRSTYSGVFSVAQTRTVRYYSTNALGAAEAPKSQLVTVTPPASPPTTTIGCNGAACASTAYAGPVNVSLAATDPQGSATTTYYTTDGSDPTVSTGTRSTYSGVFSVAQTRTVQYYVTNALSAAEAPKSQLVTVTPPPASPPTTTISCNTAVCASTSYPNPVSVSLSATDPQGSATTTYYTTDGTDPTVATGTRTRYTDAFTLTQTRTVRFYSTNALGAAETARSQRIQVTAPTAPTTTIQCNGASCSSNWYRSAPVTVRLAATDPNGDAITTYYTTDGSDPTIATGTRSAYTAPFTLSQTRTVRYYSTDATGRSESRKSQQVRIDGAAPTVSMTAPTAGGSYDRRYTVTLSATAVDLATGTAAASGISQVVFYDGTRSVRTVSSPVSGTTTYRYSWNAKNVALGSHTLTAVVFDAAGNSTTSAAVQITLR